MNATTVASTAATAVATTSTTSTTTTTTTTPTLNRNLMKILLKRRNKVIVDADSNINDNFKNRVVRCINKKKDLRECCEIEQFNGLSVTIKVNGIPICFENGAYIYMKDKDEKELPTNLVDRVLKIVNKETDFIKNQMLFALSLNENIESLGYCMDKKMFDIVATLTKKQVKKLSNFLVPTLKEMVGGNRRYMPLYPDFPNQVIGMKESTLYLNALTHYWSNGEYYPYREMRERTHTSIEVTYKNITIGKEEDLYEIMTNLMGAAEAISKRDIEDLTTYFKYYKNFMDNIPESIPNKENLAIIINMMMDQRKEIPIEKISGYFETVTDVLRLAAVMSGESPTLKKPRFKSFSNKERRVIMALLNGCHNRIEDFHRHKNMWQRMCEKIHPMKFHKFYPDLVDDMVGSYKYVIEKKKIRKQASVIDDINQVYSYYKSNPIPVNTNDCETIKKAVHQMEQFKLEDEVVNNLKIIKEVYSEGSIPEESYKDDIDINLFNNIKSENNTKLVELDEKIKNYKDTHQRYATRVENYLNEKKYDKALTLLAQRPGIFTRRLDELLMKIEDHEKILNIFEEVASKVSVKVLLSLKGYFQKRHEKLKVRVFMIKGTSTKMFFKNNVKEKLDLELCERVCNICSKALMINFENKPKMNNVFISEDLKKQVIPLDIRNSNSSLETYIKGSRFDLSYKQVTKEEHEMAIKELEEDISGYELEIIKNKKIMDQLNASLNDEPEEHEEHEETEELEKHKGQDLIENIEKIKAENQELNKKIEIAREEIKEHREEIEKAEKKEVKKIRLFIWWTNTENNIRVDIDLSVMIFDENLKSMGHVSYTALRNDKFKIYHSGDIVNGGSVDGDGVAEFIDFDPKQIIDNNARYIAVSVISYCGVKFKYLENCKFGWMERDDLNSNELFEPKTVKQRLDLNSDSTSTVPVVFDCKTNEFVWLDTSLTENQSCVNIEGSKSPMNGILYYYLNPLKDNLYNLIKLHVQSREGHLVESVNELTEGDTAFVSYLPYKCIDGVKYIRPVDLDIILSEYMTACT